jgi:hypothetical protein
MTFDTQNCDIHRHKFDCHHHYMSYHNRMRPLLFDCSYFRTNIRSFSIFLVFEEREMNMSSSFWSNESVQLDFLRILSARVSVTSIFAHLYTPFDRITATTINLNRQISKRSAIKIAAKIAYLRYREISFFIIQLYYKLLVFV